MPPLRTHPHVPCSKSWGRGAGVPEVSKEKENRARPSGLRPFARCGGASFTATRHEEESGKAKKFVLREKGGKPSHPHPWGREGGCLECSFSKFV